MSNLLDWLCREENEIKSELRQCTCLKRRQALNIKMQLLHSEFRKLNKV